MRFPFRKKKKEALDGTLSSFKENDSSTSILPETTVKQMSYTAPKEPTEVTRRRSNLSLFLRHMSKTEPELAEKILEDVGADDERHETEVVLGRSSSKVIKGNDEDTDILPFVENATVEEEREPSTCVHSVPGQSDPFCQMLALLPTDDAWERIQSGLDCLPSQSLENYNSYPDAIKPVRVVDRVGSTSIATSGASSTSREPSFIPANVSSKPVKALKNAVAQESTWSKPSLPGEENASSLAKTSSWSKPSPPTPDKSKQARQDAERVQDKEALKLAAERDTKDSNAAEKRTEKEDGIAEKIATVKRAAQEMVQGKYTTEKKVAAEKQKTQAKANKALAEKQAAQEKATAEKHAVAEKQAQAKPAAVNIAAATKAAQEKAAAYNIVADGKAAQANAAEKRAEAAAEKKKVAQGGEAEKNDAEAAAEEQVDIEKAVAVKNLVDKKSGTKAEKSTLLSGKSDDDEQSLDPSTESETTVSDKGIPNDGSTVQDSKACLVGFVPENDIEIQIPLSHSMLSGLPAWLKPTPPSQKKQYKAKPPTIDSPLQTAKVEDPAPEPEPELHTAASDLIKRVPSTSTHTVAEKAEASSKISSGSINVVKFTDQLTSIPSEITESSVKPPEQANPIVQAKPTETQPKSDDDELEVAGRDKQDSKRWRRLFSRVRLPWSNKQRKNAVHLQRDKSEVKQDAIVDSAPDETDRKIIHQSNKNDMSLSTIGGQQVENASQAPPQEIAEARINNRPQDTTEDTGEHVQIVNLRRIQEDSETRRDPSRTSSRHTPDSVDNRRPNVERIVIQQLKDDFNALPEEGSVGCTEYDTLGHTVYTEYDTLGNTIYEEDASIATLDVLWNGLANGIRGVTEAKP